MSLASFASVLFKARVRIVYVSLSLSPVQYEQVYWIFFCFFALFFQTSYFFSLKNVGMLIVTSDPPYADMTQFHQLNIQKILLGTVFLFYLQNKQIIVQPDVLVFGICIFVSSTISRVDESLFQSDGLKRYYIVSKSLCGHKANSFHC